MKIKHHYVLINQIKQNLINRTFTLDAEPLCSRQLTLNRFGPVLCLQALQTPTLNMLHAFTFQPRRVKAVPGGHFQVLLRIDRNANTLIRCVSTFFTSSPSKSILGASDHKTARRNLLPPRTPDRSPLAQQRVALFVVLRP